MSKQQDTAVALGFFDGVHRGHQAVIGKAVETARQQGLKPCAFTFTMHGGGPRAKAAAGRLMTEEDKEQAMKSLGVEEVFCPDFEEFRHMDGEGFVRELLAGRFCAKAICCGRDFRFGRGAAWGVEELEDLCGVRGIRLYPVPAVLDGGEPVSSTRIRALLARGDPEGVARLLGRPYGFSFPVAHGRRLGRTIRFPTVNQPFPQDFALPRFGVYAAFAWVQGQWRPAVSNIGVKPTVSSDSQPLAETCIAGEWGDLYGQRVPIRLVSFLRPEVKFATLEELRESIRRDYEAAMRLCAQRGCQE